MGCVGNGDDDIHLGAQIDVSTRAHGALEAQSARRVDADRLEQVHVRCDIGAAKTELGDPERKQVAGVRMGTARSPVAVTTLVGDAAGAASQAIVTLANTPHPLDPGSAEPPDVDCVAWTAAGEAGGADPFRVATPERERAFLNTDEYLLGWAQ